MARPPRSPLRVAVSEVDEEVFIFALNGGDQVIQRLYYLVSDNDRSFGAAEMTQLLPEELSPGERAMGKITYKGHRRCVYVRVIGWLPGGVRLMWTGWVFIGTRINLAMPPWPQRTGAGMRSYLTVVRTGTGPRCVVTLINDGSCTVRDLSVHLLDGDTDVSGLLQGVCPQRLAEKARATFVIEHRGAERVFTLLIRYVDLNGGDVHSSHEIIVGWPTVPPPGHRVESPPAIRLE